LAPANDAVGGTYGDVRPDGDGVQNLGTASNRWKALYQTTNYFVETGGGANYVAFTAPSSIASDVTWTLPNADGSSGQVLSTNGSGTLSWATASGGGISNVVEDTTPQLGGQLDVNGQAIGDGTRELLTFTEDASAVNHVNIENEATGSGPIISAAGDDTNIDLNLSAKGTGDISLGTMVFDADQTIGAGQDNYVLTYDNATGKISLEAVAGGGGGTVTSVDMSVPTGFAISGNPITSSGTLALAFDTGYSLPSDATQATWITASSTTTFTNKTFDADGTGNIITNIGSSEIKAEIVTGLSEETNPESGDYLLGVEAGGGALRKFDVGDLPFAPVNFTENAQTGTSYTLVLSDDGKVVTMNNVSSNTLTVPPNSSVAFPTGTQITVVQEGAGATTLAGGLGVTINSLNGELTFSGRYAAATLVKVDTDTWFAFGALGDPAAPSSEFADNVFKIQDDSDDTKALAYEVSAIATATTRTWTVPDRDIDFSANGTFAERDIDFQNQTGTTYTLVLTDAGKMVELNNASAITLTIPTNASVPFPIGTQIAIIQQGAGQVTVSSSATIRSKGGNLKLSDQYSGATLTKRGTDEWYLVGDLTA